MRPASSKSSRTAARPRPPGWASASTCWAATATRSRLLAHSDGGALTHFYLGKAYLALDKYPEALTAYESAERAGYSRDQVALAKAEALRYNGRLQEALDMLNKLSGAVEQTAEYLYPAGGDGRRAWAATRTKSWPCRAGRRGRRQPRRRLFGLALENDRHGNDSYARDLYERAAAQFPTHVGTLLNLGVLYEDSSSTKRPGSATSGFWTSSPTIRGPGCSSRTPTRRATCSTTRTPGAARIG